jgi:hypothetical protein
MIKILLPLLLTIGSSVAMEFECLSPCLLQMTDQDNFICDCDGEISGYSSIKLEYGESGRVDLVAYGFSKTTNRFEITYNRDYTLCVTSLQDSTEITYTGGSGSFTETLYVNHEDTTFVTNSEEVGANVTLSMYDEHCQSYMEVKIEPSY